MAWPTALLACLALAAGALWLGERARRRRGEAASRRREAATSAAARAARDEAEARYRAAFLDTGVGVARVDAQGVLLEANEALARQLGVAREALLGRPLAEALAPAEREPFQLALAALVRGEREREDAERSFLRPGGEVRRLRCALSALRDEAGAFRSALGLLEDVTEREALRARLADADRLASVGALAAGAAHDLADPLACVTGGLAFARELLAPGLPADALPQALAQARQALDEAHQGAARAAQVVDDLRALSRPPTGRLEPVDAAAAVRAAIRLAEGTLAGRARLALSATPAPAVLGDAARLGQAVLGLLLEAGQLAPAGVADRVIRVDLAPEGESTVVVTVRTSFPAATPRAEPLAAARRAVAPWGAEVLASPGEVALRLRAAPRAERHAPAGPTGAPGEVAPRGRVLVVDDEPYVGKTLRRILGQAHEVEVVTSAREALERLTRSPAPDVILCDLMMPGLTGMDLHAELSARAPGLAARLIFVTGGAANDATRRFLQAVANPVLEKPLPPEVLREVVAESVRRGAATLPPGLATPTI